MSKPEIKTHLDFDERRQLGVKTVMTILVILTLVATLVSYMYIRNGLDAVMARNLAMETSNNKLEQKIKYLQSEVNDLSRPGRIREAAEKELGMVIATPQADAVYVKKRK